VTMDQKISHNKTFYNGIHPGTHLHTRSTKAMGSKPSNRVVTRPTDQPRYVLEHPLCSMLVLHFSPVPEPRHFYPSVEPITIRLPCPQMAIVEMEAPFSQINFEKSRQQSYRVRCMSSVSIQIHYGSQNPPSSNVTRSCGVSGAPNTSRCAGITTSPSRIASASFTVLRRTRSSKVSSST